MWPLAPITFALAFALTFQMKAGRALTRILFAVAAALLVFVLLVAILLGEGVFGDWWELLARWAQALCWVLLVVSRDRGLTAISAAVPLDLPEQPEVTPVTEQARPARGSGFRTLTESLRRTQPGQSCVRCSEPAARSRASGAAATWPS